MEKIDKLQQLMKLLQNDTITPQEVEKFLIMVVEVVKKAKDSFERISSENLAQVSEFLEYMQSEHERILSRSQNAIDIAENTLDTFDAKLAEAKSLVAKLRIMEPKNGIDGKDADEEYIISEVLNRIELPEQKEFEYDTGEDIVEKINQLPIDEKYQIDASHIKNLPAIGRGVGSQARNLFQLQDVTLANPANNDVLKYNSTTGQWENGTGGGGGGTPGGSDTQLQYNNASAFGGITGATTNGTAVTYTTSNLIGADIKASSSAGFKILSNAGTPTALFGAGGGANSTFYGGSKLDYATASTIAILDGSKNLISADTATYPSLTELSYVKGVTSAIQTQLNGKAATLSGTTNEIAYFNSPSTIASLSTGTYPSLTELSYVKGVTSAIQTQINALANGMIYKGNWDASAGTFPGAGVAQVGWFYTVSVGGTVDSIVFEVGDRLIATTNNASTTVYAGNWTKLDATDAVTSVFGRVGNVVSANGDYTASQITNVPAGSIAATTVQAAIDELDTDKQPTGNYITALTGDITASGPGSATATIAAGAVDIAMLSATGTPSGSTYLRGDNTWATVSTGGDVSKVGTPVDNQVGVWTGDGTIEGTSGLTYDGTNLLVTGSLGATGTRLTKGWFTDLEVTNAIVGSITGNAATVTNAALTTALTVNTGTVTLSGNVANTSVLTIGAGAVSVSGTNTGDQTSVSGNAGTATALQTARTIGGVSFDGTANITVATATGGFTISGGNLALGANSITMSGSIGATGTRVTKGWFTDLEVTNDIAGSITGNAATVTNGVYTTGAGTVYQTPTGTPAGFIIASQAVGDLLYASSTTAWSRLGAGTNGHVLTLSSGVPTWAAPSGGSGWNLTGNSGTTAGTNFVGTTDAVDFVMKCNNLEVMRARHAASAANMLLQVAGTTDFQFLDSTGDTIFQAIVGGVVSFMRGGGATQFDVGTTTIDFYPDTAVTIGSAKPLRFVNGANYVAFKPGTLSVDTTWTLPTTDSTGTQALVSDGSGTMGWSNIAGYVLTQQAWRTDSATSYSPADATTYYLYPSQGATPWATATGVKSRLYIPKSGTIKAVYGTIGVAGTTSSGEDSTIAIRLNDTTSTNVSTTVETSAAINNFDNSSMSIAVSAGDFIEVLFTTPTWTTNPTNVSIVASIYIE